MVPSSNQQSRWRPQGSRVRKHALLLRIEPAHFAQHVERDPGVAAQVIDVHLTIVTDLLSVMSMRVSTKYDQIVS